MTNFSENLDHFGEDMEPEVLSKYSSPMYYIIATYVKNFFICLGVAMCGIIPAIIIVSNVLYTNVSNHFNALTDYDSDQKLPFECKYLDNYLRLQERKLEKKDLIKLTNLIVEEETPKGLVVLGYDYLIEGFFYYCNSKEVPYYYLEAIARIFVVRYNCKTLLINSRDEFIAAIKKHRQDEIQGESSNVKKNIFANLKKYPDQTAGNSAQTVDSYLKIKDKVIPAQEKANRFIYRGKIFDYISEKNRYRKDTKNENDDNKDENDDNKGENDDNKDENEKEGFEEINYNDFKNIGSRNEKKTN